MAWRPVLLALVVLATPIRAQDVSLRSLLARWRVTGEAFEINDEENLSLLGVHFDLLEPIQRVPEFYVGVGGYGALTGERGGLFIGGVTLGWLKEIRPSWNLDIGLFAGGGGGGGGSPSDGLLLRPHIAIEREFEVLALRLEFADFDYGDGDIDDAHLLLGLSLPAEVLVASPKNQLRRIPEPALVRRALRLRPLIARLYPDSDARVRESGEPFDSEVTLTGIGLDYFLGERFYLPFEATGALGGDAAGYAAAFAGLGVRVPLLGERIALEARGLVGSGGGGDVDSGGGYGWQAQAGISARFLYGLGAELTVGRLGFPDGAFDADVLGLGLTWTSSGPELAVDYPRSRLTQEGLPDVEAEIQTTRFLVLNKTYSPSRDALRGDGSSLDTIQLFGVGVEHPFIAGFSLFGQAFSAWDGDVGGYAEGLFGVKYEFEPFEDTRHAFFVTAAAGAGGGGGVDVGSGLISGFGGGYRYALTPHLALSLEAGTAESNDGPFEAEVLQYGIVASLPRALFR